MFRFRSIRTKMITLSVAGVFLTAASIVSIIAIQKTYVARDVDRELTILAKNEVSKIATDVYHMCQVSNDQLAQQLAGTLNVVRDKIDGAGGVSVAGRTVTWNAVNQYTQVAETVSLPAMNVGGKWLGQVYDAETSVPAIDAAVGLTGGTATVFQRMNERGDMLRVATNVLKTDGTRAIGTYIPAQNPDGTPNPVVSSVMRGETFRGRAYVVNAWYITVYEPILDAGGRVIGMLYAGIPQENVTSLRRGIMDIVVGKSGYVFVLGGKGSVRGDYIISFEGKRDGENIYGAKDANDTPFIQQMIDKALVTSNGSVDYQDYWWLNKAAGETEARKKISAVTYFEPWDWVIGAGAYEDDFKDAKANVGSALDRLMLWGALGAAAFLALCAFVTWMVAVRITNPLVSMVGTANALAEGDVNQEINVRSKDETGNLAEAFRKMITAQKGKAEVAEQIARGNLA
ncbi:MAG: Cache 3/Cache 2 fusion domain-containing protein, partial [Candidatus Eisenbacteria bacterium]|nr:Cache 3/Cache 2 fusion domain-containing protein [Candidatus Eisenbacteria bacterium]